LPESQDGESYSIISRSDKFQLEELYLTYQRISYVDGAIDTEDMVIDDENDIEY
jgi:hypothetical protein